ncbi:CCR4-NOT transcription complex subunit 4-like isoform X2 [Saccostrea echinata]|uniref:CCR4-NOT transcription complex subunit 4-like isoform X2 n=1 Tax=Saccostrea echinata TaxID=191078 RepID=UPI002A8000AF|nr:CCR4-NOT transcription complex subunit 4-like isoform X2 [Saccostrea echinata]
MSSEEPVECPLCMEPLEIDDINFFPCTCGYQICRFCWHRIRTDENGLCPACRKQYPEDPAEFKPLTEDELQRIRKERRQKDLQRKQKAAENRKHLANVRVVQKNLVFVVGLSKKLADPETLKKQEYFGKFGKIHKVVINQSTSYAGSQGPSASAYVTYNRCDDALKAILAVNNVHVDGRTLKASLGTTKYCSHFLRGAQCQKQDCMYLHELGEEAASFTKEEMQMGKHQEYEQKLLEQYMNSQNLANSQLSSSKSIPIQKKTSSPITVTTPSETPPTPTQTHSPQSVTPPTNSTPPNTSNREAWPCLQQGKIDNNRPSNHKPDTIKPNPRLITDSENSSSQKPTDPPVSPSVPPFKPPPRLPLGVALKPFENPATSLSLFSGNGFHRNQKIPVPTPTEVPDVPSTEIADSIPVSSCEDWQAAFGFSSKSRDIQDDDLGFDPWDESSKGLADLLEKESSSQSSQPQRTSFSQPNPQNLPPDLVGSRMMNFLQPPPMYKSFNSETQESQKVQNQNDVFSTKDWQDGLRALLPNINISFGAPPTNPATKSNHQPQKKWGVSTPSQSWMTNDPAILSSGSLANNGLSEGAPHWLKSIHQLTEVESSPFMQHFPPRHSYSAGWPTTQNPPPGFQSTVHPTTQHPEPHKISEGLQ